MKNAPKKSFPSLCIALLALLLVFGLTVVNTSAQSPAIGAIEGRVFNATEGSALRNVVLSLEGTSLQAVTDDDGTYRIAGVPVGAARLSANYLGFAGQTVTLTVAPGGTVTRDFELSPRAADEPVRLGEFTVVADREMSAQAVSLNERRLAPNIINVVAYDEYGDRSAENIGDFLRFLPGVSIDEGGGQLAQNVIIRGLPAAQTGIELDGAQVATARGAGRGNSLFDVPTANISRVEVSKVPTPDKPANSLGGSMNIIRRNGFESRRRVFSYQIYHVIDDRDGLTIAGGPRGPSPDFAPTLQPASIELSGLVPVNRNFAFNVTASQTWRRNPMERDRNLDTLAEWNFVNGFQRSVTWQSLDQIFRTWSFQLGADWRLSPRDTLNATVQHRGIRNNIMRVDFAANYGAGATGDRSFTQGAASGAGTVTQAAGDNGDSGADTTHSTLKYLHRGNGWRVEGLGAYSYSTSFTADIDNGHFNNMPATITGLVIRGDGVGEAGGVIPARYSATRGGAPLDIFNGGNYVLGNPNSSQQKTHTHQVNGRLDFTRDFAGDVPWSLKTGLYGLRMDRDRKARNRTWTFRPNGQTSTAARTAANFDVFDGDFLATAPSIYGQRMGWLSSVKFFDLFRQRPDWFVLDEPGYHQAFANNSTELTETISATYLRGDVRLLNRRLWLVGGVRYEHTQDDGRGVLNDPTAQYVKDARGQLVLTNGAPTLLTTDALALRKLRYVERGARASRSYDGFYPSVNATFNLTENLLLRAAYARTIGRPDLGFIIPGVSVSEPTAAQPTITVNNTGLKPWTGDNYDLSLETYQIKGGSGSIGIFRKDIKDFFGNVISDATPELLARYSLPDDPLYLGYDVSTRTNAGNVKIIGYELGYTQSLLFLPRWASGLQVFVNATRLELSGSNTADFEGYAPRDYAGGINLVRPRYSVKLSFTYQGETQQNAVAASAANGIPANTFQYKARVLRIGLNAQYSFSPRFAVFGSINNLNGRGFVIGNRRYAPDTPEYMRQRRQQEFGATVIFGVKGQL
jgi:iron complex outermembrane receptor protein